MATSSRKSRSKNPVEKAVRAVKKTAADAAGAVNETASGAVKGVTKAVAPKRRTASKSRKGGSSKSKSR